jgi:hypothetical protein
MGLDTVGPEPPGQPETVPAGLKGDRDALNLIACRLSFLSPSMQQFQQLVLVRLNLLQRLALHAGNDPGDEGSSRVLPVPDVADDARCELWSVLIGSIGPIPSAANWSTVN